MKKRWISLFLSLCILCSLVSSLAFTASAADEGVCGDGVTWYLSGSVLSFHGTGMMYDYSEDNPAPWSFAADRIHTVNIIGEYVYYIGDYAFSGLSALTTVNLDNFSASIGEAAFMNCTALTEITIPGKFLAIGNKAFAGCTELTSFTWETHPELPNVRQSLGSYVFIGCSKLENVSLPQTLGSVGGFAFMGCPALEYIHIPGNVETVSRNMFFNCTNLKVVSLGDGIKTISPNAFAYCESLHAISLPNTLESIQAVAFSNCTSLTKLAIPAEVKTVSGDAFENCSNLKHLHFLGDMPIENGELTNVPEDLVICYTEEAEGWENCLNTTHKADYYYMLGDEEGGGHIKKCDLCPFAAPEDHEFINGYCQQCNAENPVKPITVDVKLSHTVSFDSDLQMNYRVKLENLAAAVENYVTEGAYLVVEKDRYPMGGGEKTVETVILRPDLVTDETRMLFNLPGIQSVEMGSELRAVLHFFDEEGTEYATTVDVYSVLAYAQSCFDYYDPTNEPKLFTLLIDTLNYGAAAQLHFDRRADEPVNAGMEAYQKYATTELSALLTDVRTYVENDRNMTAVTDMGFTVTFADKTEINAKLTVAEDYGKEEITAVKVLNEAGEEVAVLTEFTELDDGRLQVTFTGVKSVDMRNMYYFVAYVGEEIASQNVGYSIEAYAKSNIASADAKLADLALKCMYYGDSAYACFAEGVGN